MASIRKRSGKWQARVIRAGFPQEVKTFPTQAEAQRWARSIESQMDRGTYLAPSKGNDVLLRDLLERYAHEVSPTKRGYADEIIRIKALQRARIASFSLATLTPSVVADFRNKRLQSVAAGAVIRDLSLLSSVINHARREWGITVSNPCALVRKPPTPSGRTRVLTSAEEVKLLKAIEPVGRRSLWMLPLVQLALETAMRRGELLSLQWEDVDLTGRVLYLRQTKNGTPRAVPLSTSALAVLRSLPNAQGGFVLPISAHAMEAAFKRATKRAGIEDLRFHDLRHTATTRLAQKLPNVIELAAVTGHKTLQMLKRYYHPDAKTLAQRLG